MIYELNEMIDHLDRFFESSHRVTVVGGIAGTQIEKLVLDSAVKTTDFSKVLVLNGCQDYIGLMKNQLSNVLYYADLIVEDMVDYFLPNDVWKPFHEQREYQKRLNLKLMSNYDIIIVFNSHLIPDLFTRSLVKNFSGKIIMITDPLEIHLEQPTIEPNNLYYSNGFEIPTIVDSLEKTSPLIAMARNVFGIETRSIDRNVSCKLTEIDNISKRALLGKIDDYQCFTNDSFLLSKIQSKQINGPIRKNQRFLVVDDKALKLTSTNGSPLTITRGSMLIAVNPNARPLMQMRVHNSKMICGVDIKYAQDYSVESTVLKRPDVIYVRPGNISHINTPNYAMGGGHRFNKVIAVLKYPLQPREKYTLLKNSNNLIIVNNVCKNIDVDNFEDENDNQNDDELF